MNKVCNGLVVTLDSLKTSLGNEGMAAMDPDGLIVSKEKDFMAIDSVEFSVEFNWDSAVAACRAWYDAKNWAKPFCCQSFSYGGEAEDYYVVNASKASSADDIDYEGTKITPYAEAFKEAARLGGVAVLLSAVAFMQ